MSKCWGFRVLELGILFEEKGQLEDYSEGIFRRRKIMIDKFL
jgi:hypothetical protein